MNPPSSEAGVHPATRRISSTVALTLLRVLRAQDIPAEVLEDEDPVVTMPRRLGLSEVVERQIRNYEEDVRRGVKATDQEFEDLVKLVIRRPDSEEIFLEAGRRLALPEGGIPYRDGGSRWPDVVVYALARRRARRLLRRLFGRRLGGFADGAFALEASAHLLVRSDPGGDACALMTGLCHGVLERTLLCRCEVVHTLCQARGDEHCRWEVRASG
ncbi:MAG: hypothetical protein D6701_06040 [Gemmatimonadetes bacterium]|nr:MAG: hypothetical protein D6701_06040 [Gemmatimonadota bacterium]